MRFPGFLSSWLKRFSKMQWIKIAAGFLAAQYIRFVYKTSRWVFEGEEYFPRYWCENRPFIVCFWHGRLLLACAAWKKAPSPFHMLISSHSDGEIIARTVGHFGIRWIPGSSQKKGTQALRTLMKTLSQGHTVGVTPDGPHGPCHTVGEGVVRLAQMTKCDILPLAFSTSRYRILTSWDRFFLALPFSRGAFVCGKPISPLEEPDTEKLRTQIAQGLHAVTTRADQLCGVSGDI